MSTKYVQKQFVLIKINANL